MQNSPFSHKYLCTLTNQVFVSLGIISRILRQLHIPNAESINKMKICILFISICAHFLKYQHHNNA